MFTSSDATRTPVQLRDNAEIRILTGLAPPSHGWTIGATALTLLHHLASNPATASDALKLLHELQVHQVELDLQHEHIEEDRRELQQRADHYSTLYDCAPIAYFTVDKAGRIIEGNLTAVRLLGAEPDTLGGRSIDGLVAPASGPALRALLEQALSSGLRYSGRMQAGDGSGWLQVAAIASPRAPCCLIVATGLTDASMPAQQT